MNHELSIQCQAAERYLEGALSSAEREAFENHFFECEECAEEVRLGFRFREAVKDVFREDAELSENAAPKQKSRMRLNWFQWIRPAVMAPAAAAVLLAVTGYQNLITIPNLRTAINNLETPQVFNSSFVLAPASRASTPAITVPSGAPFFQVSLAIGTAPTAARYECELRSESGKPVLKIPVTVLESGGNLALLLPSAKVPAGYYDLVLLGIDSRATTEIDHYRFAIRKS